MSSCFSAGCTEKPAFRCKCTSPETFICLHHLGIHAMKGTHIPEPLIGISTSSEKSSLVCKIEYSLNYLTEVQNSIFFTSKEIIAFIKSETSKFALSIQSKKDEYKKVLSLVNSPQTLIHNADFERLQNMKYYNTKNLCDKVYKESKAKFSELIESISFHELLKYQKPYPEPTELKLNFSICDLRKIDPTIKCSECQQIRPENEFLAPSDLRNYCYLCLGTYTPETLLPTFYPPPDFGGRHGGKHHGGGHHGGGHKKHHGGHHSPPRNWYPPPGTPPPQKCPPHIRPVCAFPITY